MSKNILGIDVSKRKLMWLYFSTTKPWLRSSIILLPAANFVAWLETLHREAVHVCLESTGTYGDLVAHSMHNAGHIVSVVNPLRIKSYAVSALSRNKTDMVDARMIADFVVLKSLSNGSRRLRKLSRSRSFAKDRGS
ncbi:MAG: transposase [Pyrinomonadaceae bacterium]